MEDFGDASGTPLPSCGDGMNQLDDRFRRADLGHRLPFFEGTEFEGTDRLLDAKETIRSSVSVRIKFVSCRYISADAEHSTEHPAQIAR